MTDTPSGRRRALGLGLPLGWIIPNPDANISDADRAELLALIEREGVQPAPPTTGGPTVFPQVTTRSVDFQTLVLAFRPRSQDDKIVSYRFSNGREFIQPGDRDI